MRQPGQMLNFIHKKISEYMKPSHPTFIFLGQPGKWVGPPPYNRNPGGPAHQVRWNVVLDMDIFSNLAEKKKLNMAAANTSKFKWAIHLCK